MNRLRRCFAVVTNYYSIFFTVLIFSHICQAVGSGLERKIQPALEQSYAAARAKRVDAVSYKLSLELDRESDRFSGVATIDFIMIGDSDFPLTIDFEGGEIDSIILNGLEIPWTSEKWFIGIAADKFKNGSNVLTIRYTQHYSSSNEGLYRYKDLQTGNVYLYSNFEPFGAHKMFPHFDQPDIKASYTLDVSAPESWQVISTTREASVTKVNNKRHWQFSPTALIPSYVFSLHAGPYQVWEDEIDDIPLRLFARKEMTNVNYTEWFSFTKNSFSFFNNYFSTPYAFKKYDQIIVPNFNPAAMENIAAVTFSERYAGPGIKTNLQRMQHEMIIAHEIAHMWLGNLVTMRWWNDLWLKESFATYLSYLAQSKGEFGEKVWDAFYSNEKLRAYAADQKITSRPIALSVINTEDASNIFNGISYGKGAALLRQLSSYLGAENFRSGINQYINKFAYENAETNDFLHEMGLASNKDLSQWKENWILAAGINTIQVRYKCNSTKAGDVIDKMEIIQSAPIAQPDLRSQSIQVGLYTLGEDGVLQKQIFPVTYAGAITRINNVSGFACPDFVYPNASDEGYVKVKLDKKSLDFVTSNFNKFEESLRLILWQVVWGETLDGNFSLKDYVGFVDKFIHNESRDDIIVLVASTLTSANNYFWLMRDSRVNYKLELQQIEATVFHKLQSSKAGSDEERTWFATFLNVAHTKPALEKLYALLLGQEELGGIGIGQFRRWMIIKLFNQFQYKNYQELTAAEQPRDKSFIGQQLFLASEAIRPQTSVKDKALDQIMDNDGGKNLAASQILMANVLPVTQKDMRVKYAKEILNSLQSVASKNDISFVNAYLNHLLPQTCTLGNVRLLQKTQKKLSSVNARISNSLLETIQEEQRCINMKKRL